MLRTKRIWATACRSLIAPALFCGCYQVAPPLPEATRLRAWSQLVPEAPTSSVQQTSAAVDSTTQQLTLDQVLQLALSQHPDLAVAQARAQAARGRLIQAGLYPNPIFRWHASQIGNADGPGGEQGPVISQTIITGGKRQLAEQASAFGVNAADWQAVTWWYTVLTRVRVAWYERLAAQREVAAARELSKVADDGLAAAEKLLKGGTGTQPDVLRARVEVEQSRIRLTTAEQRESAARRQLAVAAAVTNLGEFEAIDDLDRSPPELNWDVLREHVLTVSSEVQEAQALVCQNERLVARARAEVRPDVQLLLSPFYDFTSPAGMRGLVDVGVSVPLFNRNQGNIHGALADLARSQAEVRQVELRLTDRLTLAYQRYETARKQRAALSERILPNARESLRLMQLGYERGDPKYDYTAVLQAQAALAQARLADVQAQGELWKALSEIQGLLQVEELH